jgi:hypothetical protein
MAGYTRQSIADIINGADITAPPVNAEFNQITAAFNGATGHSHDGSTGNAPKIDLATSVSGYLPAVHGGIGGKNNFVATTNPLATDDAGNGYAPGSMWENTTTGRVFICVGNTSNAAVWRELVQVQTANKIIPEATNTVDLGEPSTRFQDLWLAGGLSAFGNGSLGGTLTVTGATALSSTLAVTGTSTFTGTVTSNAINATTVAASAGFTGALTGNVTGDLTGNVTGNVTGDLTGDVTGDITSSGTSTFNNLDATGTTTITSGDINSGAMDGTTIGASTPAAGTFTNLTANTSLTAATADINGGTVDNATIGATTPSTGAFTTISTSGQATLASADINGGSIDGATIGATSHTSGKFSTLQSTGNATLATADINGGTIDGTAIGSTTASSGAFTTVSATGGITGDLTGDVTGNVTGNVTGAITGNVTGDLTGNVTSAGTSTFNNVTIDGTLNMNAGTTATITNLTTPTNANDAATKGYVDTSVADLVDAAPGTLDTLNELAAALNDDPNFSTTITNSIATKLPLAGGTMSGAIAMGGNKVTGVTDPTAAQDAATKAYVDQQDGLQVTKSGDSMSGNLAMGSNNITGLATPTANDHATNKSYVDGILGSATAAAASASAAATSESNAATSETNAANSASSAAADLSSVQSLYDQFDDRYLGSKASAPTVDNDGNALLSGALYFNSTANIMYVYGGSGWVPAGSSVNGTSDRVTYTASAGQTVFAATYDAGYVDVYLNGVKLVDGTDFTATNGTSVVLTTGAAVNDIVDVVAYGTFTLADHYTKTQADARYVEVAGDTMTGALTTTGLTVDGNTFKVDGSTNRVSVGTTTTYIGNDFTVGSTDPKFILDNGAGSVLAEFSSEGTSTNNVNLKALRSGELIFSTNNSPVGRFDASGNFLVGTTTLGLYNQSSETGLTFGSNLQIARDGGVVQYLNRLTSDGDILQFRKDGTPAGSIGSDAGVTIYMDGGGARAGIYMSGSGVLPRYNGALADNSTDLGASNRRFKDLHLSGTANVNTVALGTDPTVTWASNYIKFQTRTASVPVMELLASASGNYAPRFDIFNGQGQLYSRIDAGGGTVFNEQGEDLDFRVESDSYSSMLTVDGGGNYVGIQNAGNLGGQLNIAGLTGIRGRKQSGYKTASMMRPTAFGYSVGTYAVTMLGDGNTQGTVSIGYDPSSNPSGAFTGTGGEMLFRGNMSFYQPNTADNGYVQQIRMTNDVGVTINEGGADLDFRVESDAYSHMFFLDASTSVISVGNAQGYSNVTSIPGIKVGVPSGSGFISIGDCTSPDSALNVRDVGGNIAGFYYSNSKVGGITASSSGTTYNTTSDARLKDNIETITDGTDKLMAMNPVTHTWKADPEAPAVHGFIAQEMQEIVPEAVSGDPDGEEMMSMDYGRITPVLVAALQDAMKEITALKERVAELEAK